MGAMHDDMYIDIDIDDIAIDILFSGPCNESKSKYKLCFHNYCSSDVR